MARVSNSNSIARLIARELRSGNRFHDCEACGGRRVRDGQGGISCVACPSSPTTPIKEETHE